METGALFNIYYSMWCIVGMELLEGCCLNRKCGSKIKCSSDQFYFGQSHGMHPLLAPFRTQFRFLTEGNALSCHG